MFSDSSLSILMNYFLVYAPVHVATVIYCILESHLYTAIHKITPREQNGVTIGQINMFTKLASLFSYALLFHTTYSSAEELSVSNFFMTICSLGVIASIVCFVLTLSKKSETEEEMEMIETQYSLHENDFEI